MGTGLALPGSLPLCYQVDDGDARGARLRRVYPSGVNDTPHDRLVWEMTGWDADERLAHVTELSREEILRIRDLFDRRLPPAGEDEWLACAAYEVTHDLQPQLLNAVPRLEFKPELDYFVEGAVLSD